MTPKRQNPNHLLENFFQNFLSKSTANGVFSFTNSYSHLLHFFGVNQYSVKQIGHIARVLTSTITATKQTKGINTRAQMKIVSNFSTSSQSIDRGNDLPPKKK